MDEKEKEKLGNLCLMEFAIICDSNELLHMSHFDFPNNTPTYMDKLQNILQNMQTPEDYQKIVKDLSIQHEYIFEKGNFFQKNYTQTASIEL